MSNKSSHGSNTSSLSLSSPSSDFSSRGSSHSSIDVTHETTSRGSDYDQTAYDKEGRRKYTVLGTGHEKTKSRTIIHKGSDGDDLKSMRTSVHKNRKDVSATKTKKGAIIVDNRTSRVKTTTTTTFGRNRDGKSGSVLSSQKTSDKSPRPSGVLAWLVSYGPPDSSSELSRSDGAKRSHTENRGYTI